MEPSTLLGAALASGYSRWNALGLFALALIVGLGSPSAEASTAPDQSLVTSDKRAFDVPAGEARAMLRRFAQQASREIVFAVDSVTGIQTNSVQGQFTIQEGLDRMLAGTGLVATLDD